MGRNVRLEADVRAAGRALADPADADAATLLATVKRAGFGDRDLATLAGVSERDVRAAREALGLRPGYAMVDTCAAEFAAETPYFYATYASAGSPPEALRCRGPQRSSSAAVRCASARASSSTTARSRPRTCCGVPAGAPSWSTPTGDGLDRLRRLDPPVLRAARRGERPVRDRRRVPTVGGPLAPIPAVVAFGGQTPLNLAAALAAAGVSLLGSDLEAIDQAEERTRFAALLDRLGIPQPEGGMAHSVEEAVGPRGAHRLPGHRAASFVIGGLAIDFAYSPEDLVRQLAAAAVVDPDRPVRIDRYLEGIEVDVDAVCDGATCSSRASSSTSSGRASTRVTRRRVPAADTSGRATRT